MKTENKSMIFTEEEGKLADISLFFFLLLFNEILIKITFNVPAKRQIIFQS